MNGGPFQADLFDPKPAINKYAGQRPEAVRLRTENQTGGLMPVPFGFHKHGQRRPGNQRPVAQHRPLRRRPVRAPLAAHGQSQSRPGPVPAEQRHHHADPAQHGLLAVLRPGQRANSRTCPTYVVLCPGRPVRFAELWSERLLARRAPGHLHQPHEPRPGPDVSLPPQRHADAGERNASSWT